MSGTNINRTVGSKATFISILLLGNNGWFGCNLSILQKAERHPSQTMVPGDWQAGSIARRMGLAGDDAPSSWIAVIGGRRIQAKRMLVPDPG
jgi:hypothetical protein